MLVVRDHLKGGERTEAESSGMVSVGCAGEPDRGSREEEGHIVSVVVSSVENVLFACWVP